MTAVLNIINLLKRILYHSSLYKVLGIISIICIWYSSIVLIREPYKLDENVTWYVLVLLLMLTLAQVLLLYILIKAWRKRLHKGIFLTRIMERAIVLIYYKPLYHIGEKLLHQESIRVMVDHGSKVLIALINKKSHVLALILLFQAYPKLLIAMALLTDILLFSEIRLFFEVIWYALVPIIFRGMIGLISIENRKSIDSLLSTPIDVNNASIDVISSSPLNDRDYISDEALNKLFVKNISDILKEISLLSKERIYLTVTILIGILFLVAWAICVTKITILHFSCKILSHT